MREDHEDLIPTRWTLIERLKNWDDQESWREFFDAYWKLIYGVARKAGLSPEDAQDVVQETVVSVCKAMAKFKADPQRGSFKGWLLTVTRNRIIDRQRKKRREPAPASHATGGESRSTRTEERIPDPAGNAFDDLWNAEWERNVIALALEKLERQTSVRHYQIFLLHVIKQHPAEQVATLTGVDTDQVYLIKHRLAPQFRAALEQLETRMA
jgi:RNA polymerase sigma factor (sigma-70 family)